MLGVLRDYTFIDVIKNVKTAIDLRLLCVATVSIAVCRKFSAEIDAFLAENGKE